MSGPSHKYTYQSFIEPNYEFCREVSPSLIRQKFQAFMDGLLAVIPNEPSPADAYMYNSHMGEFARKLDQAKDEFTKGLLAYYRRRNSCVSSKVEE